jgi:hypothetical protein
MITTAGSTREQTVCGQVWTYDFKTGQVEAQNPKNMAALKVGRFAREAVYLPKADLMLVGYVLQQDGKQVMPVYDPASNEWLAAELPGCEFMARRRQVGTSVGLGLVYDPKRDLTWAVLCQLKPGSVQVLRFDRESARLAPIK